MERVGFDPEWMHDRLFDETSFYLIMFDSPDGQRQPDEEPVVFPPVLATWSGVLQAARAAYGEAFHALLAPHQEALHRPYHEIDPLARIAEVSRLPVAEALSHPEYMTPERALAVAEATGGRLNLYQARAACYHTLGVNRRFAGDGFGPPLDLGNRRSLHTSAAAGQGGNERRPKGPMRNEADAVVPAAGVASSDSDDGDEQRADGRQAEFVMPNAAVGVLPSSHIMDLKLTAEEVEELLRTRWLQEYSAAGGPLGVKTVHDEGSRMEALQQLRLEPPAWLLGDHRHGRPRPLQAEAVELRIRHASNQGDQDGAEEKTCKCVGYAWPTPPAPRAAVLLVHGFGARHEGINDQLAAEFAQHGIAAFSVDLPGHGRSIERSEDAGYIDDFRDLIAAVEAVVRQVARPRLEAAATPEARADWEEVAASTDRPGGSLPVPLFVHGTSMGGAVALEAAHRLPDVVAGVVALSPMVQIRDTSLPSWPVEQMLRLVNTVKPRFALEPPMPAGSARMCKDSVLLRWLYVDPFRYQGGTQLRSGLQLLNLTESLAQASPEALAKTPMLLAHGERDSVTCSTATCDLHSHAMRLGADSTAVVLEGAWHVLYGEPLDTRERLLQDTVAWVSARGVGPLRPETRADPRIMELLAGDMARPQPVGEHPEAAAEVGEDGEGGDAGCGPMLGPRLHTRPPGTAPFRPVPLSQFVKE